ncbi:MAG: DUF434 domain-containing protein [Myxococcales bacterium]|nr:DUF434 domain-containing protein [Myxococcales bacterium]
MARGPAQDDRQLFAESALTTLRTAAAELSWLLSRGYASHAALELVGNRHDLWARQRTAVLRCSCSDEQAATRRSRSLAPAALAGRALAIDGFNLLIVAESAFAGGVLLRGRDGVLRDMASVHGSYRRSEHTLVAATAIGERLAALGPSAVRWVFDRPVSNSGRLATTLGELARERGWPWTIELDFNPDKRLVALVQQTGEKAGDRAGEGAPVIASGDAWILDQVPAFVDLAADLVMQRCPQAWLVDLDLPTAIA